MKHHNYGRVNQFDIRTKLDGLDEKFRVLDNEPLADALRKRLEKLDRVSDQWKPELLSLFLNLSDRPVDKSRVGDLDLLRPSEPPSSLTWAEIIAEDPLTEEGIWDEPDFGDDSSEDAYGLVGDEGSKTLQNAPSSIVSEEELSTVVERYVIDVDHLGLEEVEKSQFWRQALAAARGSDDLFYHKETRQITELQTIRECIFMLSGATSYLFTFDQQEISVCPSSRYSIEHVSSTALHNILLEFAKTGSMLNKLRQWLRKKVTIPLMQTFQYTVECRVRQFQQALGRIERRFVALSDATIVSLQAVLSEVQSDVSPLLELAILVAQVPSESYGPHYQCLELLYRQTCDSQMTGNIKDFEYFCRIFFECLQTYLRLLRRWMEDGEIDEDDRTFLVQTANRKCDASSLWHERYELRELPDGAVHAPMFVQTMARRIFNTGRSVAFLKAIGHYETPKQRELQYGLDYESVCGKDAKIFTAPFAEIFSIAFERWVKHCHHSSAQRLHAQLDQQCGLWNTLDAFEYIYFSRDGIVFQDFAWSIFDRLDRRKRNWNDRFILTDVAQSIFGSLPALDTQRLTVRTASSSGRTMAGRTTTPDLGTFALEYAYPWPIMNILRKHTLVTYHQIFTLLLQILHAKYHLVRVVLLPITSLDQEAKLTYSLRQRLLWFTDTFHTHIVVSSLAVSTAEMRGHLAAAEDVDAMTKIHQSYIGKIAAQSLLTKNLEPIQRAIKSMLDLCLIFSKAQNAEARRPTKFKLKGSFGSSVDHYKEGQESSGQRSQRGKRHQDSDDSDIDDDEGNVDDAEHGQDQPYLERLRQMLQQFDELYHFIVAGLRGISRAGEEASWEMLAEKLEWK